MEEIAVSPPLWTPVESLTVGSQNALSMEPLSCEKSSEGNQRPQPCDDVNVDLST